MELEIAKFILGMVDMSVASELPEYEHLQYLVDDLQRIQGSSLYYYLCSAYENYLQSFRR